MTTPRATPRPTRPPGPTRPPAPHPARERASAPVPDAPGSVSTATPRAPSVTRSTGPAPPPPVASAAASASRIGAGSPTSTVRAPWLSEEEIAPADALADGGLDALGQPRQDGRHPGRRADVVQQGPHQRGIEPGADVPDRAPPVGVPGHRGPAGEVPVREAGERLGPFEVDDLRPQIRPSRRTPSPTATDRPLVQRPELLHPQPQQLPQRRGTAAGVHPVVGVDDPGEERHQQLPAVADVGGQPLGVGRGEQIQIGRHDEPVAGQLTLWRDHVAGHTRLEQRPVVVQRDTGVVQRGRRLGVQLQRPPAVPVRQQRHLGPRPGPLDARHRRQLPPQSGYFAEDAGVGPAVRQHRRVELLRAAQRLPPLEVQHRVRALGDGLPAPQPHRAGRLGTVAGPPVDRAGRLFQQHPGLPGARRAHQVEDIAGPDVVVRHIRVLVEVQRHRVHVRRPGEGSTGLCCGIRLVVTGIWGVTRSSTAFSAR